MKHDVAIITNHKDIVLVVYDGIEFQLILRHKIIAMSIRDCAYYDAALLALQWFFFD